MKWPWSKPVEQQRAEPQVHNMMAMSQAGMDVFTFQTGGMSRTGMPVNEQTVMNIATVYGCMSVLASALAAMPLRAYKDAGDSRERVPHTIADLFNSEPWPTFTAATFWEYVVWSMELHGDFFGRIHRVSRTSPVIKGIEPIHPLLVEVQKIDDRLVYLYDEEPGKRIAIDQDDMFHVPGIGFNGLRGMSKLRFVLKNVGGVALAADEFTAAYYRNGGKSDIALVAPGNLKDEQVNQMREQWAANQGALSQAWKPYVLSGGVKIEQLQISAEDAALIATCKLTDERICRIFRVPPHMVGITDKATSFGNGIEQLGMGFVTYTLSGIYNKIEQEANRKCLRQNRYFFAFDTSGLLRGDTASRYSAYRIALGRAGEQGFMDVNEIRAMENMPPKVIPPNPGAPGHDPEPVPKPAAQE